ncbi:hypothetical protein B9G39_13940 [Zooshikella ganghwensis]|uniref:Uncharacterized protein n=1 Tax=Zooshikella ganghwensis TaxID=202772 RepID=A0A4P9VP48_9GAMM|nr:hypothetical protein B9G39_13940 [Zooshikella ganghwensis]
MACSTDVRQTFDKGAFYSNKKISDWLGHYSYPITFFKKSFLEGVYSLKGKNTRSNTRELRQRVWLLI